MQEYRYYIGGEFKTSREKIEVINPATEEVFAKFFEVPHNEVMDAVKKAKSAQKEWRNFSFPERARILREIARVIFENVSSLAELESREIGKCFKESLLVDIPLGAEAFNYYASFLESWEDKLIRSESGIDFIKYEPFGVAEVFLPYNVPLMIFGFSCSAALAGGNSVIVKPSEYGSLSILHLAKIMDTLDIPKGLINIVTGRGESVGRALTESEVDILSFTGSRKTLSKVISFIADRPKKIICELGGCNLNVIFSDANQEDALQNLLGSSFIKQGQMCIGTSIALIERDTYSRFVAELLKRIKSIKLGDPFDATVGIGPLATRNHLLEVDKKVKELVDRGGRLLCGGEILKREGYFYPPTVIEVEEVIYEEFFAPVILISKFDSKGIERMIDNNPTGLVLQVWTNDLDKAQQLADKAECGTVWINTFAQMTPQLPFGGVKLSGWGRTLGKAGFFEYVQSKHIGIGFKKSPVWGWFGV